MIAKIKICDLSWDSYHTSTSKKFKESIVAWLGFDWGVWNLPLACTILNMEQELYHPLAGFRPQNFAEARPAEWSFTTPLSGPAQHVRLILWRCHSANDIGSIKISLVSFLHLRYCEIKCAPPHAASGMAEEFHHTAALFSGAAACGLEWQAGGVCEVVVFARAQCILSFRPPDEIEPPTLEVPGFWWYFFLVVHVCA